MLKWYIVKMIHWKKHIKKTLKMVHKWNTKSDENRIKNLQIE